MRITMTVLMAALIVAFSVPAFADLQNVKVGGSLRIRGNWYSPEATAHGSGLGFSEHFQEEGNSTSFVEMRTRLNVTADFTNDVTAFIELDSYDWWGEDFRSDYITGVDSRAGTADDVEIYQAYIETRETFGWPVRLRIGRQEMMFGSEWLVGNNDTSSFFRGLSFDGIRLDYEGEVFTLTGFWTKVAETSPLEEDGDIDFYGVYGTYHGFENWQVDAYWMYLRDARGAGPGLPFRFDTPNIGLFPNLAPPPRISGRWGDGIEDLFGVDQYSDTSHIHTFGLRGAGNWRHFDFEAEVAYQTGDAVNATRSFFQPDPNSGLTGPTFLPIIGAFPVFGGPYAEDDAEYDNIGANLEVGYTFDNLYQLRLWLGAAYFEGEDNREDSFGEYLRSLFPFYVQQSSIGFNRLFSDWEYSEFLANTDLSNALILRGGASINPTESTKLSAVVSYFKSDRDTYTNGIWGVPFFSYEHDDEIGFEVGVYFDYDYSDDLSFSIGYAHFFADDGAEDGNFIAGNGLLNVGGSFGTGLFSRIRSIPSGGDDDADYVFAETSIKF